jgi:nucleoside-diphosphate-sugar epimerase
MKVTITGISGFVGNNLSVYLKSNKIDVIGLTLRGSGWISKLDTSSDAIIHLAGIAHDTSNTTEEIDYFKVNKDLTIELFEGFIKSDIRDFFYFSSVKAVADTLDKILTEEEEGIPTTPYGKSKLAAEEYLQSKILPNGKRLFIIRPCMIHGEGNKGNLNLLYKFVKRGIPWPLADFNNKRSFLSIDNLNFLILEMLNKSYILSGIYNFSDDDSLSTNKLVILISQALGKKPRLLKIPSGIITKIVEVGDLLGLPLSSEHLKKLTENFVVSNNKIKSALGINQLPLLADEGLKKTFESFNEAEE